MKTRKLTFFLILIFLSMLACSLPGSNSGSGNVSPTDTPWSLLHPATPPVLLTDPEIEGPPDSPVVGPDEDIHIQQPGNSSLLTSPISLQGWAQPTFEQNLVIRLVAFDGTELAETYATIQADIGNEGPFIVEVPFSIGVDTQAILQVSDISARDGGLVHVSSVWVTLLASGMEIIESGMPEQENILIQSPSFLQEISGGSLTISGFSEYYFEANLGVVICGEGGGGASHFLCGTIDNLIAEGYAMIDSADMGEPGPFSGTLSYSISSPTQARVVVYAVSPAHGEVIHLSSQMVILSP